MHRFAAVGGDGGPLARVEGEAVDLAEVAVEAGEVCKEALGWWRAARSVALPRRGQYTDWEVANPRDPICCCCVVLVNEDATQISFLGLEFTMPIGVAKLFSAAAGVLVIALIGGVRIHRIRPTFDKRRR